MIAIRKVQTRKDQKAFLDFPLKLYKGNVLFASHDHEFIETVANRIIELTPNGIIDKMMEYDEYIASDHIKELKAKLYGE